MADYVISDSPVFLTGFYQEHYTGKTSLMPIIHDFYDMAKEDNVEVYNFFLTKNKKYNPAGRYQTEEQAEEIGKELKEWLERNDIKYYYLDCPDKVRVEKILEIIGE